MRIYIYTSLIFLTLLSCTKEDREVIIIEQEASIDKYISSKFADNKVIRNNFSNRVIITEGISAEDSLEFGDSLSFYYAGSIFNDGPSEIFATNIKALADSLFPITNPSYEPINILFNQDIYVSGLTNGLLGVKEKEHSIIIFSAKYGFDNESVYNIPKLSALFYEVQIDKITKNNK